MSSTDKRAAMQRATKNAFRTRPHQGWAAARKRARLWCHFMWPDDFIDPREAK